MIPPPVIEEHGGVYVVRDDLVPGGTKARAVPRLFDGHDEYVYASPVQGFAQIALAYACAAAGHRCTVFCAERQVQHRRTAAAERAGAVLHTVRPGYLGVVQARARQYAAEHGACLLPFGLACEEMVAGIAAVARALPYRPREVWSVAGSGTLQRGLQRAWPDARFYAVRVGVPPDAGRATVLQAPERYERDAMMPPPFPSCGNYDAKAWRFIVERATPGALFWNVAGDV